MILNINVPNILTVIRILLTPLLVIFLIKNFFTYALIVFTVAGISDGLDGLLARYYNQHTELGAYLDPIADKLLLISSFLTLAVLKLIPGWLSVIVISRDVLILLGIAMISILNIHVEINPSLVSKCTTIVQLATVFFTLLNPVPSSLMFDIKLSLFWITAVFTIVSCLHYLYIGINILQKKFDDDPKPE